MSGAMQGIIAAGGGIAGAPQNQTGGVNTRVQPDGTNLITTGSNATPVNWFTIAPQTGAGSGYWFKATDTGLASGTAAALTGASISGFTPLTAAPVFSIPSGIGARNYSYQISSSASGTPVVASGTSTINNTI